MGLKKPFIDTNVQSLSQSCKQCVKLYTMEKVQKKKTRAFVLQNGKPSDYCKNPNCTKSEKKRRYKQSGLYGYCLKCAPKFISAEAVLARKKKHNDFLKLRKEKFPCDFCQASYYFRVDLETGKHYCKVCWPKRKLLFIKCNFCFTLSKDVRVYPCEYKKGCLHRTVMCLSCHNIHDSGVCVSCWFSEFKRGCFQCGELIVHSSHVRRRFCDSCSSEDDIQQFANELHPVCFFCKDPQKPFLQFLKCQQALHCQRRVHVCFMCYNVRDKVPCSVCYRQSDESSEDCIEKYPKCFSCGLMSVQKDKSKWGYFCKECFHFHNEKLGMKLWYKNIFGSFPK